MSSPDIITPKTNTSLHAAVATYGSKIAIPCFLDGADGFAKTYLGEPEDDLKTLVTGDREHLAISVDGSDGDRRALVNVDLAPPNGAPASIVEPGLYNKQGKPDPDGEFSRPIKRPLTETEGVELIMDLHAIMKKIPLDRQR